VKDCNHESLVQQANEMLIRSGPFTPSELELDDADRPFYIVEDLEDLGETTWDLETEDDS